MWEIIADGILLWIALAAGFATAGGFIAFISLVGILPRLAAITKTARHIPFYENCLAAGLILMNFVSLYPVDFSWLPKLFSLIFIHGIGLFTGIFVGCLAGALAEVINIIPILSRRIRLRKGFPLFIKAAAVGKCIGSLMQFYLFSQK
ncbi:MAG: stage V sporulation protein AB [Eubacteriales bacterium]|nr:stage V sporulation protein AB [Eubacteriales bacterium]